MPVQHRKPRAAVRQKRRFPMSRDCHAIDRRSFMKLAASGLALAGCGAGEEPAERVTPPTMRYRPLGRTGLKVSEIAFGAHGMDNANLMRGALEAGINTFCTSGSYLDGREETALGTVIRTLGSRRDELVVMTGESLRAGASTASVLAAIDASLRRLGTDRIDVFYTAMVESAAQVRAEGLLEAFAAARQAGKVRHLALSSHNGGMQSYLDAAIADRRFEVFFIRYDFVSYPELGESLHRAAEQGIGTIVFKTDAGRRQREIKDLESGGLSFRQATLKWALGNPDVSSVAVTVRNFGLLRECAAAVGSKLAAREADMLRRYAGEMADKYCRFCRCCERRCPRGVAIADVMRYDMYFAYYAEEREAMRQYGALPGGRTAESCAGCEGLCDSGCPFRRRVHAELVAAHRRLSFVGSGEAV
jgi:aryl-alcohol dehydrogenase-like predicted oxidoreductase